MSRLPRLSGLLSGLSRGFRLYGCSGMSGRLHLYAGENRDPGRHHGHGHAPSDFEEPTGRAAPVLQPARPQQSCREIEIQGAVAPGQCALASEIKIEARTAPEQRLPQTTESRSCCSLCRSIRCVSGAINIRSIVPQRAIQNAPGPFCYRGRTGAAESVRIQSQITFRNRANIGNTPGTRP